MYTASQDDRGDAGLRFAHVTDPFLGGAYEAVASMISEIGGNSLGFGLDKPGKAMALAALGSVMHMHTPTCAPATYVHVIHSWKLPSMTRVYTVYARVLHLHGFG